MIPRPMLFAAALFTLTGCSTTGLVVTRPEPAPRRVVHHGAALRIPPGHLPPPGQCRVWYPGRPPGHQPPPGSCASLARRVPPGAWLVSREGAPGRVRVSVFDNDLPGMTVSVRVYSAADGRLLEEE